MPQDDFHFSNKYNSNFPLSKHLSVVFSVSWFRTSLISFSIPNLKVLEKIHPNVVFLEKLQYLTNHFLQENKRIKQLLSLSLFYFLIFFNYNLRDLVRRYLVALSKNVLWLLISTAQNFWIFIFFKKSQEVKSQEVTLKKVHKSDCFLYSIHT